jgi:hypothetical protein
MGAGGRTRFLAVDETIYNSLAWRTLPGSAAKLWLDLKLQYRGNNNGQIIATMSVLEKRGWKSKAKLARALETLIERGFLVCTRKARPNVYHIASMYGFTDKDVAANAELDIAGSRPTHAYLNWVPATEKTAPLNRGRNGPSFGGTTAPDSGERKANTAPVSGERKTGRKANAGAGLR